MPLDAEDQKVSWGKGMEACKLQPMKRQANGATNDNVPRVDQSAGKASTPVPLHSSVLLAPKLLKLVCLL
jgi:hypothetical protein